MIENQLHNKLKRHKAFTLAEVLITLGIIGVVAAMTIPTLINNYQKESAVTSVKAFYSEMSQAIKLSEVENGPTNSWDYGDGTVAQTRVWFDKYLAKYLSSASVEDNVNGVTLDVYLNNGLKIGFFKGTSMDIPLYIAPGKTNIVGRNVFRFLIDPTASTNAFRPYDAPYTTKQPRNSYITGSAACTPSGGKGYCAALMMVDGWKIADDYPW